jgi:hypothetical protein
MIHRAVIGLTLNPLCMDVQTAGARQWSGENEQLAVFLVPTAMCPITVQHGAAALKLTSLPCFALPPSSNISNQISRFSVPIVCQSSLPKRFSFPDPWSPSKAPKPHFTADSERLNPEVPVLVHQQNYRRQLHFLYPSAETAF